MKSILEHISNVQLDAEIFEEEMNIWASETIITESFKSSILQKLAQKIYDAEKVHNQKEIDRKDSYSWSKPNIISFASVLGPITTTQRFTGEKTKTRGVKWADITDDDFKEYGLEDKELVNIIKKTYGKNDKSVIIITTSKDEPVNLIKAFNEDPTQDGVFYFKIGNNSYDDGIKQIRKPYYTYKQRPLKVGEVLDMLKGLSQANAGIKAYALEITDSMTQEYQRVVLDRKNAQKGVINYDKESLEALAKQQRARYEVLAKKMKESKLSDNMEQVWKDIEEAQKKVTELMKEAIKPENMDKVHSMSMVGDLMRNVSYAYESLLSYYKNSHDSNKRLERAKQRAKDKGEEFNEEDYLKWDFDHENATKEINRVVEYLKDIDKEIENIKKVFSGQDV